MSVQMDTVDVSQVILRSVCIFGVCVCVRVCAKQLRLSRVACQWASTNCKMMPWCAIFKKHEDTMYCQWELDYAGDELLWSFCRWYAFATSHASCQTFINCSQ